MKTGGHWLPNHTRRLFASSGGHHTNDNMPGTPEALLRHVAGLNGVEFVAPELDEDGWPKKEAA